MSLIVRTVTHVSVILSEATPLLVVREFYVDTLNDEFYVDTLNDGSVARVPISMSLTLSLSLTNPPEYRKYLTRSTPVVARIQA